jgi:hypothetical protein
MIKKTLLIFGFISFCQHPVHAVTAKEAFPDKGDYKIIDGVPVRKGTIYTSFLNSFKLDDLLSKDKGKEKEIEKIIKDQRSITKGLYLTKFFDMQPISTFLKDEKRPGRIMVAVLTLQECPQLLTEQIKTRLGKLIHLSHPILKREIQKVIG